MSVGLRLVPPPIQLSDAPPPSFSHVARLSEMGSDVHFAPGELIFHEGDHSSFFYLLITGTVALEVVPPAHPVRIATLYAGEVLGW